METDDWPRTLAREFAPYEESIAEETVRLYAKGGRSRRSLLRGTGESTGGFDGSAFSGDLVGVLQTLDACGQAVLGVLGHPALSGASTAAIALAAWIDLRCSKRDRGRNDRPDDSGSAADLPPELLREVDLLLQRMIDLLADLRGDRDEARNVSCRLVRLLVENARSGADFVRGLNPSRRGRSRGRRGPLSRWFRRGRTPPRGGSAGEETGR